MVDCCVCKKTIGFFSRKVELSQGEYCHKNCYFDSKQGKSYTLLVNARCLHINNQNSSALKEVDQALILTPDNMDLLALKALVLRSLGKHREALEYAEKAFTKFNKIYGNGFIVNQLKKTHSGKISQEWIIKNHFLVDMYGDIIATISYGYSHIKKYAKAIPFLEEELKIYPNDESAMNNLVFCQKKSRSK